MNESPDSSLTQPKASRTAIVTCLMRSVHTKYDRPALIDDTWADKLILPAERSRLAAGVRAELSPEQREQFNGINDDEKLLYWAWKGLSDRMKTYLSELGWLRDSVTAFKSVFGTDVGKADEAWLVQQKSLALIPMDAILSHRAFHWQIATWFALAYGLLAFSFLWMVRQCFRFGRFAFWLMKGNENPPDRIHSKELE